MRSTQAEGMTGGNWIALGLGFFLGGIVGAAIGVAVWMPVGVGVAFFCGVMAGVAGLMLVGLAE